MPAIITSLDALLKKTLTSAASLDAIVFKGEKFYIDAKLNKSQTATISFDAILEKYNIFPWSDIDLPNNIEINDIVETVKHNYQGYSVTRPLTTKIIKTFTLTWNAMSPDSWMALVEFWRTVYGDADSFYFQFPVGLYGVTGFGGKTLSELPFGFDSEYDFGYGTEAIFLVKFVDKNLPQKWVPAYNNRWQIKLTVREQ